MYSLIYSVYFQTSLWFVFPLTFGIGQQHTAQGSQKLNDRKKNCRTKYKWLIQSSYCRKKVFKKTDRI